MPSRASSMIAWLEPTQADLLRAIALQTDTAIIAAGSPSRGQTTTVAAMLGCDPIEDLRQSLAEPRADLLLMLTPPELDFAGIPPASIKLATIEPIPDSALAPVAGDWSPASTGPKASPVHFIPLTRFTAPFQTASELLLSFGEISAISHESLCLPGEGTLGARLFSAMDLLHMLIGEPDTVDAAFVPAPSPGAAGTTPGETLRGLHGTITASLRFPGQRSATLTLSNQGARWNNTTTLIGAGGRLRLFDDGFEWLDPAGTKLDEMRPKRARASGAKPPAKASTKSRGAGILPVTTPSTSSSPSSSSSLSSSATPTYSPHCLTAISDSLRRLLANTLFPEPPAEITSALALGQTALLSCRTGQPESPATIRRMLGGQ